MDDSNAQLQREVQHLRVEVRRLRSGMRFIVGFVFGLLIFLLANIVSHFSQMRIGATDQVLVYGFPLPVWIEGGLPRIDGELNYFAVWADIAIALLCGTVVGVLFVRRARHDIAASNRSSHDTAFVL